MTTDDDHTPAAATAHRVDWFDPQRPVSGTVYIRPDAVHKLLLEELAAARATVARLEAELAEREQRS